MTIVMVLLLSSAAMAETATGLCVQSYIVKKGDCLWKIGQKFGVSWLEIARVNEIRGPQYIIYPKQKLIIQKPVVPKQRFWKNVGGNPYKGTWPWAIENFDLPAEIKNQLIENIKSNSFRWFKSGLKSGQKLTQVVFGKGKVWNNVLCQWPRNQLYAAKDYGVGDYHLIQVLKCKNWAWWIEEKPALPEFPPVLVFKASAEFPVVPVFEAPPTFPPIPVYVPHEEEGIVTDEFDLYMGGGTYESVHYDAQGYYLWGKIRYRPFEFSLSDDLDLRIGVFAFGGLGGGHDEDYDYHWKKWVLGPTAKLVGLHWDADFDAGIGKLYNKGGVDLYRSEQVDDIFLLSAHGNFYSRRDRKEKWLPKTELNFEVTWPYNESHQHSWAGNPLTPNPYDNRVVELSLTQGIYDLELADHLRLTPGFNLGVGREYGLKKNFYQFGPRATLSWHNEDIISVSFLNFKEQLGGNGDQWHWLGGWLSISGLIKAYKASQITEATAEDLK
jgi:LysM repeat protein